MSDIMPGQPGDTNTSARGELELMAFKLATAAALVEPKRFTAALDAYRAEVLAEALAAVRGESLAGDTDTLVAYRQGVTNAVAAIEKLLGGAR